jgi:sugar phosphate isomerase/epimerase
VRLSFSTLGCPAWSLSAVIDAAARLGYDGVELRFLQNDDALWARPELTGDGLADTRVRLSDAGLRISCVDTRSFFHHPEAAARETAIEEAARSIELAASLGAAGIRVFGDRIQPGQDRESTRGFIADALERLAVVARAHEVEVWLESHGDFARARDTLSALDGLGTDGLGVVWDPANAFEVGESPAEGLAILGERARHVHLKDVAQDRTGEGRGWIPRLPGKGEFMPERVFALLAARGYDRWVSFEWEKRWYPALEEPEVALPHFARWASRELGRT